MKKTSLKKTYEKLNSKISSLTDDQLLEEFENIVRDIEYSIENGTYNKYEAIYKWNLHNSILGRMRIG